MSQIARIGNILYMLFYFLVLIFKLKKFFICKFEILYFYFLWETVYQF